MAANLQDLSNSLRNAVSKAKNAAFAAFSSLPRRDDKNDSYIYPSLIDRPQDSIRVLELHPGNDDAPLECTLKVVRLTEEPTYEAISYTWKASVCEKPIHLWSFRSGNDEIQRLRDRSFHIFCAGKRISIDVELQRALKRLRHHAYRRTLWVDQICIDQKNVSERNLQLLLIKPIYNRAARVILWIGEEGIATAKAFDIINKLASVRRDFEIEGTEIVAAASLEDQQLDSDALENLLAAQKNDVGFSSPQRVVADQSLRLPQLHEWGVLASIYRRPVFERMWVVQEVCVARTITVHCGSFEIDWAKFAKVAAILQSGTWIQVYQEIAGYLDKPSKGGNKTLHTGLIKDMISWRRIYHCELENTSWGSLLSMGMNFNATDPRDKIFALFGMAAEVKGSQFDAFLDLMPSYTDSVAEVYTKATSSLLSTEHSLDVLCRRYDKSFDITKNLPSWVPDFALRTSYQDNFGTPISADWGNCPYRAANDTEVRVSWPNITGKAVLATRSYHAETITEVSLEWDASHYGKVMLEWSSLVTRTTENTYITGERLFSAFWRTCVLSVSQSKEYPAPKSCGRLLSAYIWATLRSEFPRKDLYDGNLLNSILVEMLMETMEVTWNEDEVLESLDWMMKTASRRLYVTERGYMGLCNKSVKAGDQVHILSGGHVPFILRPMTAESTETANCYSFMGDTYIHGLMDGEALNREDFKWTEVHIE